MKPTEVQYPIIGQLPEEQRITDNMVAQIGTLVTMHTGSGFIPLADVLKITGSGLYLVLHMHDNWDEDPDVASVIKANLPNAVVKHGTASRGDGTDTPTKSNDAVDEDPNSVTMEEFFAATMCLIITEGKDIMMFRGPEFPPGIRFTI